ncbi:hypothetical protein CI109_106516 [Kwoniella shandongensis]|uniref:Uncharacterized protein n=1 Tax=Kwoniella shandongensis TaxID=1734106 RepID=A0A5M6C2S3_9TREE|nr:uncharacterized protein CI109_002697 [Kwoniella shandongensis]KAA5528940.1 hypothetical protein CI109_002697 [Kwoniella shandongensis]
MHDTGNVIFSGIGVVLVLLPLPLHWRARNSGTLLLITWLLIGNLVTFIDGIVWWDNYNNPAPVWCDIVSKIFVGLPVGISASSLCITRRLAMIASSTAVTISQRRMRIALAIDLFLGIALPLIIMALHYVVQAHRFDILEGYGCSPVTWPGVPGVFAVQIWAPLLSVIASVYGVIAIKFFLSRRLQFESVLRSSRNGLDSRHYLRLVAIASVDILVGLPLTTFTLVDYITRSKPYVSWHWLHLGWSRVDHYAASAYLSSPSQTVVIVLPRWFPPLLALHFFIFFGVSVDAITEYIRWFGWAKSRLPFGLSKPADRLPFAAPKLGSTVAQPSSVTWREPSITANADPDPSYNETSGPDHVRSGGVIVSVSVERQVV